MFDSNIIIGIVITLGSIFVIKSIEWFANKFYDKVIFGHIWNLILRRFKLYISKERNIKLELMFSFTFIENYVNSIKENISKCFNDIPNKFEKKIKISNPTWSDDDLVCKYDVIYEGISYDYEIQIKSTFDYNKNEYGNDIKLKTDSILFKLIYNTKFKNLDDSFNTLSSNIMIIKEACDIIFSMKNYGKGKLIISPINPQFKINDFITKDKLNIGINIETEDRIYIDLFKNKAEIVFPNLLLDHKVLKYVREVVLHYYL